VDVPSVWYTVRAFTLSFCAWENTPNPRNRITRQERKVFMMLKIPLSQRMDKLSLSAV
jgi:hypothetical protein